MKALGYVLLVLGLILGGVAFSLDTSVSTESTSILGTYIPSRSVANLSKMDDRRNLIGLGESIVIVGVLLIGMGTVIEKIDALAKIKGGGLQLASATAAEGATDSEPQAPLANPHCPTCLSWQPSKWDKGAGTCAATGKKVQSWDTCEQYQVG